MLNARILVKIRTKFFILTETKMFD